MNNIDILFEDSEVLAAVKPAGVPSQGDKTGDHDMNSMVIDYLKQAGAAEPYAALIHRLDRTVGGIMLFAKTKHSAGVLSEALAGGKMQKNYLSVIVGKAKKSATLKDSLLKNERTNLSKVVPKGTVGSKDAVLHYSVINRITQEDGTVLSLLLVDLETGRHHQIRAQLSNAGMPIWGDVKYGGQKMQGGFCCPALWSYRLTFPHPKTGKRLTIESVPIDRFPFSLFYDKSE